MLGRTQRKSSFHFFGKLCGHEEGGQPGGMLCGCMMEASLLVDTIVSKVHLGEADQQGLPGMEQPEHQCAAKEHSYNLPDLTLYGLL